MNKVVARNNNFVNIIIATLTFLFFALFFFPKIDISFSELFYINGKFIYKENCFAIFIFKSIPIITKGFVAVVILIFFYSYFFVTLVLSLDFFSLEHNDITYIFCVCFYFFNSNSDKFK